MQVDFTSPLSLTFERAIGDDDDDDEILNDYKDEEDEKEYLRKKKEEEEEKKRKQRNEKDEVPCPGYRIVEELKGCRPNWVRPHDYIKRLDDQSQQELCRRQLLSYNNDSEDERFLQIFQESKEDDRNDNNDNDDDEDHNEKRQTKNRLTSLLFEQVIEKLEIKNQEMEDEENEKKDLHKKEMICGICCGQESEEDNLIVICDGCDTSFHQSCYNIAHVPEGKFYCYPCRMGLDVSPKCQLCSQYSGAYVPLAPQSNRKDRFPPSSSFASKKKRKSKDRRRSDSITGANISTDIINDNNNNNNNDILADQPANNEEDKYEWVHCICVMWTPGASFVYKKEKKKGPSDKGKDKENQKDEDDDDDDDDDYNYNEDDEDNIDDLSDKLTMFARIDGVDARRFNLTCSICNLKKGSCIQCSHGQCATGFHPTCAFNKKLSLLVAHKSDEIVNRNGYCKMHAFKEVTLTIHQLNYDEDDYRYGEGEDKDSLRFLVSGPNFKHNINFSSAPLPRNLSSFLPLLDVNGAKEVVSQINDGKIPKEMVDFIYDYWANKRNDRQASLLKFDQDYGDDDDDDDNDNDQNKKDSDNMNNNNNNNSLADQKKKQQRQQKKKKLRLTQKILEKYHLMRKTRRSFEQARTCLECVRKRERIKRSVVHLQQDFIDSQCCPLRYCLRFIWQQLLNCDEDCYFHDNDNSQLGGSDANGSVQKNLNVIGLYLQEGKYDLDFRCETFLADVQGILSYHKQQNGTTGVKQKVQEIQAICGDLCVQLAATSDDNDNNDHYHNEDDDNNNNNNNNNDDNSKDNSINKFIDNVIWANQDINNTYNIGIYKDYQQQEEGPLGGSNGSSGNMNGDEVAKLKLTERQQRHQRHQQSHPDHHLYQLQQQQQHLESPKRGGSHYFCCEVCIADFTKETWLFCHCEFCKQESLRRKKSYKSLSHHCSKYYHPCCLDPPLDMAAMSAEEIGEWTCDNCKVCSVCQTEGDCSRLVICERCNITAMHIDCMTPPLNKLPDYYECPRCVLKYPNKNNREQDQRSTRQNKRRKK